MTGIQFRAGRESDLETLKQIMVEAFDGVSIDQAIEREFGPINGHSWQWRKARHLDDDFARDPAGIIVAECDGRVLGFISTAMDRASGIGSIPNISLRPDTRGQGIGRQLIELALQRFRDAGLTHAKIETLAQNAIGNHLYRSVGFREVTRQVHFAMSLSPDDTSPSLCRQ